MNKVDSDSKNVKKCPDCGGTMGINRNGQDICACEARENDDSKHIRVKSK